MKLKKIYLSLGLVSFFTLTVFTFQNCSESTFSSLDAPSELDVEDKETSESFSAKTTEKVNKADILFVLDESVSMDSILSSVRSGFASITGSSYPSDTLMAVTNTAPAQFTNASQKTFNVNKPFNPTSKRMYIVEQPGFIQVVSKQSLAHYKSRYPNDTKHITLQGCSSAWFKPKDTNAQGKRCLDAHTQISLQATGVEAGKVSLYQLVALNKNLNKRTFRQGTLANVIFISDTHDPGASYYGNTSSGGLNQELSYSEIRNLILSANPGLAGLKFHGIVPLPPANHSAINGLSVIGALPATLAQSQVNTEELYGFSYLPLIKSSGGVAMHVAHNNWKTAINKMVEEIGSAKNPRIRLSKPAIKIISIKVNNQTLAAGEYNFLGDKQNIEIIRRSDWPENISITVKYSY